MSGKVYLVGAGPGRPDLITVRGLNILKEADVVIYDYLVDRQLLGYTKEGAELVCCDRLAKKGRYSDGFSIHQEKITDLVIEKAKKGKKVIRLKNGDPSIFSRCSQELEALVKSKIEFEIVPGVTAASAASCLTGIPLTDRKHATDCVFVTGHEAPNKDESALDPSTSLRVNPERSRGIDWNAIAKNGTVVLYMAVENLANIVKKLVEAGKDKNTPVVMVQNASLLNQRVLRGTLKDIAVKAKDEKIKPPAIIIIGKVAKLEKNFNWLRKNKRVLFTGLSEERFFIKGTYFYLPLIKICPLENYDKFDDYLRSIRNFDWVVFASRYGVGYFFKRLNAIGNDARALTHIKIAAVGNSTKNRLLDFGIHADLVPREESSRGLLKRFKKENINGKRIFMPRSDLSDKGLKNGLKRLGAVVTSIYAYSNVMPADLPNLDLSFFDEIMFTSPSTVRNFKKRYGKVPKETKISCIGDVTLAEAQKCKLLD